MQFSPPVQKGVGVGLITLVVYLTVVVVSTPSLRPVDSVAISIGQNWWLIGGVALGAGVQVYLISYAKVKACPVRYGRTAAGASGVFSGLSSFLSFLSLIPVGCCGTWIYVLAFLPGLIGVGASGFLVRNGFLFEILGLVLMALSVAYTYVSVRRRLGLLKSSQDDASQETQHLLSMVSVAIVGSRACDCPA